MIETRKNWLQKRLRKPGLIGSESLRNGLLLAWKMGLLERFILKLGYFFYPVLFSSVRCLIEKRQLNETSVPGVLG
jgi:hypothetical protein